MQLLIYVVGGLAALAVVAAGLLGLDWLIWKGVYFVAPAFGYHPTITFWQTVVLMSLLSLVTGFLRIRVNTKDD